MKNDFLVVDLDEKPSREQVILYLIRRSFVKCAFAINDPFYIQIIDKFCKTHKTIRDVIRHLDDLSHIEH